MQVWKKFSAIALALVMSLALCAPAFADDPIASDSTNLTNGEAGGYTQADTPNLNTKVVYLEKEITAYNPSKTIIYGPEITYTYTVTPAEESDLKNVTDNGDSDHANKVNVTQKTQAGVTTGVKVNGSTTAGTAESASGTLEWTNADILSASATGAKNTKLINFDFTNVVFENPGIYRYKIVETAVTEGKTYETSGVTDKGQNTRYLDVYVMRSNAYTEKSGTKTAYEATDWTIYGYVCTPNAESDITKDTTTKTNGFINNAASGQDSNADQYRTYNLTLKKTLQQDTSMENHQFPFTVAFDAGNKTGNFQLIAEKSAEGVTIDNTTNVSVTSTLGGTVDSATILKLGNPQGLTTTNAFSVKIAHGKEATFIGIPNGTTVTVTETNDVVGTTYSTSAKQTVGTGEATDVAFDATDSTGNNSTDNKSVSIDNTKTAVYKQADATTNDTDVTIEFTNLLSLISPTGVTLRYAPYLAMMGAGIVALPLSLRKKEEEI